MVQAPDARFSSGAGCDGGGSGRLSAQRCLGTCLLRTHGPEAWDKAQRLRQAQWARPTRQVTALNTLAFFAFLSLDKHRPAQRLSAVVHR